MQNNSYETRNTDKNEELAQSIDSKLSDLKRSESKTKNKELDKRLLKKFLTLIIIKTKKDKDLKH